jgi:hypothetical protein
LDIDFLPAAYRQKSMQRRAYIWRVAAAAMIISFFTVAALFQWRQQAQVKRELELVETQYADAVELNAKFAEAAKNLQAQHRWAELLTFLRHRWPRSQILAAILEPMPESVKLTECHIGHEALTSTIPTPAAAAPVEAGAVPGDQAARRAADLKRLLQESARRQPFVSLSGEAGDAATLHEYLARLGANSLFARVDLRSLEHRTGDEASGDAVGRVQFTARALIRQEYTPSEGTPAVPGEPMTSPVARQGAGS